MNATLDVKGLREKLAEARKLPSELRDDLRTVGLKAGLHIIGRAIEKAPVLEGHLRRSGRADAHTSGGGVTIELGFGGQAAEYAEYQHDTDSLSHSGPRKGKWVYLGEEPEHPGDWNDPRGGRKAKRAKWVTARAGSKGAVYRGAQGTQRWNTGGKWRRARVKYRTRVSTAKFRDKTGQSHFLYGRSNSAIEEELPTVRGWVAQAGERALRKLKAAGAP